MSQIKKVSQCLIFRQDDLIHQKLIGLWNVNGRKWNESYFVCLLFLRLAENIFLSNKEEDK